MIISICHTPIILWMQVRMRASVLTTKMTLYMQRGGQGAEEKKQYQLQIRTITKATIQSPWYKNHIYTSEAYTYIKNTCFDNMQLQGYNYSKAVYQSRVHMCNEENSVQIGVQVCTYFAERHKKSFNCSRLVLVSVFVVLECEDGLYHYKIECSRMPRTWAIYQKYRSKSGPYNIFQLQHIYKIMTPT